MKKTYHFLLAASALALAVPFSLHAQERGKIAGKVVDEQNAEPMVRATVRLMNTKLGGYTNTDGEFIINNVEPGTYSIQITYAGYSSRTIEGVVVSAGRTTRQDASITRKIDTRKLTVTTRGNKQSTGLADLERRRNGAVSDNISAQEIGRAPASDAGDAMKRVTGVTIQGGKYVVVRGLTERYSSTQVNDVSVPSPEPEKKVVPFDIFPSSMISRLTTVKTFMPDNPGDFAGGLVKIDTKDYPESFLFSAGLGGGVNTGTHGNNEALGYNGGSSFLGTDDGTRALPAGLAVERRAGAEAQADLLSKFTNNVWTPRPTTPAINRNFNLSIGNKYGEENPIGFLLSGSYAQSTDFRTELQRYPLLSQTGSGERELRYDYTSQRTEVSTLWGGLASVTAQLAPEHKVSVKAMFNHSAEDEARETEGLYNQSTTGLIHTSRLRFVERELFSGQVAGNHQFDTTLKLKMDWRAAYSVASRSEPDNRATTYIRDNDGVFRFANNFGSGNSRFFSSLDDAESTGGLDITLPFTGFAEGSSRVKVGGLGRLRSRDFSARRFVFNTSSSDPTLLALEPEKLFTPENIRSGQVIFNEETQRTDRYSADESIAAGYAMVDLPLMESLRFIGGVRFEQWNQDLSSVDPFTGAENAGLSVHNSIGDLLPSVNLIYSVGEEMNLRASFSQTLARPEFRELAPFRFDDYRQSVYGNPALERTQITNYDLRWEWFQNPGEVLAVSGFYKSFINPIELFYLKGGSGVEVESANANKATNFGAEFEARKMLGSFTSALDGFSLGMNLTLVKSTVEFGEGERVRIFDGVGISEFTPDVLTNRSRPMQGQSPYVLNLTLGYDNPDWGTQATLLYNIFGERLSVVGNSGIPDTYEQPRGALDVSVAQNIGYGLQLKLSVRNLLDSRYSFTMDFPNGESVETESYNVGRSISIGLGFSFDQLQSATAEPAPSTSGEGSAR